MIKHLSILFFLFYSCCIYALNSVPTTEGTEFYVTFMNNIDEYNDIELMLIVSSRTDATVTILNPQTNWTRTYTIQAQQVEQISVPRNQAYTENAEIIEQRGLLITSTSPISLYASNYSS